MATITQDLGAVTAYGYAKDAGYTGTEAEFTQLLGDLADTVADLEGLTVSISTLPAGSSATASYSDGVLSLGIPKGDKGDTGNTGATGPAAGFGEVSATVDSSVGTPSVEVSASGPDTAKQFAFAFHNLKGDKGDTGEVSEEELAAAIDKVAIKDTASGPIASFPDGADGMPAKSLIVTVEPNQDLHGYDNPWPAGGGKNLFDKTATDADNGYIEGKYLYPNGEAVGTSGWNTTEYIPVNGGATYTISPVSGSNPSVCFYDSNKEYISGNNYGGATAKTFTTPDNAAYIRASYKSENADTLQIEVGSSATSYAPYSNICPITGWTGANVSRTGFNVWDEEWEEGGYNSADGETGSGTYRIRNKNIIPIRPNTTYYAKTGEFKLFPFYYDKSGTYISAGSDVKDNTFTTPANAYYLNFYLWKSGWTDFSNHGDTSINYPSTDHDYHAYAGQTKSISFPSTIYGGTDEVVSGSGTAELAMIEFDGSEDENWQHYTIATGELFRILVYDRLDDPVASASANANKYFCNSYKISPNNSSGRVSGTFSGSYPNVDFVNDNYTTIEAWRAYLAQNPIQFVYPLATPSDFSTTPTQIDTLLGQNNIWANCGDTSVTYRADTGLFIDKKLAQVLNA